MFCYSEGEKRMAMRSTGDWCPCQKHILGGWNGRKEMAGATKSHQSSTWDSGSPKGDWGVWSLGEVLEVWIDGAISGIVLFKLLKYGRLLNSNSSVCSSVLAWYFGNLRLLCLRLCSALDGLWQPALGRCSQKSLVLKDPCVWNERFPGGVFVCH